MTKKELEQLYYLEKEINMCQTELDKIRSQSLIQSPSWQGAGGHSGVSDKVADMAIKEADLAKIIEGLLAESTLQKERIREYVDGIDDCRMRMIMKLRYIELKSWNYIASVLGGNNTANGVRMAHNRFLEKF